MTTIHTRQPQQYTQENNNTHNCSLIFFLIESHKSNEIHSAAWKEEAYVVTTEKSDTSVESINSQLKFLSYVMWRHMMW